MMIHDTENTLRDGERLDEVNENISLIQKKDGLTFGTDAYLLAAFIKPMKNARAVELGAGTGIISFLLVSRKKVSHVTAVELQSEYAELSWRNAVRNNLENAVTVLEKDVRDLTVKDIGQEVELVFSNPPYMRTDTGSANRALTKNTARHETAGGIDDFCLAASRLLKHGGTFCCVYRPDRLADLFRALSAAKLEPKRLSFVAADTETAPSMVLVEARKGGATGLTITPTLLLHRNPLPDEPRDQKREMTPEAAAVYDTCVFYPMQNAQSKRKKEHNL